jgi:hypothetical protein
MKYQARRGKLQFKLIFGDFLSSYLKKFIGKSTLISGKTETAVEIKILF